MQWFIFWALWFVRTLGVSHSLKPSPGARNGESSKERLEMQIKTVLDTPAAVKHLTAERKQGRKKTFYNNEGAQQGNRKPCVRRFKSVVVDFISKKFVQISVQHVCIVCRFRILPPPIVGDDCVT